MYCENAKKTTVNYINKYGVKSNVVFNHGNIEVICEEKPRTGKYIFTAKDGGLNSDCTPQRDITYYTNIFIADSYQAVPAPNVYWNHCAGMDLIFYIGNEQVSKLNFPAQYLMSRSPNPNYSPGGKALKIKNAQGILIFTAEVKDCNFDVACDDDCPPGHIKCKTDKYPGYCCTSCSEVAAEVNKLTNLVQKHG